MKDVETSRLKYLYHEEGGLTNLFNWKLNQFLKFFSDYGTSPVKSLIISLYVVLGFAALYFFFYSDWDQINRTFLMRKHQKILSYFKTEQRMEDFYTDKHKKDFQTYEEYKREVVESKVEVPFFVRLIGKPLYQFALIKHKLNKWLYRRMEILKGKWVDLNQRQKVYRGTVVSVTLVLYMVYLICIRSMNSIVLSINTFSTLGFGDIPVHGVSRYIAILEGFLGWFLLSIFSVSLIGQLLQSA
jgi:hypothetical protein